MSNEKKKQPRQTSGKRRKTTVGTEKCPKRSEEETSTDDERPILFKRSIYTIGNGFYLKPSKIPGAGMGVYTRCTIQADTHLSEYVGKLIEQKDVADSKCPFSLLPLDPDFPGLLFDGYSVAPKKGNPFGPFINDPRSEKLYNAEFEMLNPELFYSGTRTIAYYNRDGEPVFRKAKDPIVIVVSTRDIMPGEELFVDYGNEEYWKVFTEVTGKKPSALK